MLLLGGQPQCNLLTVAAPGTRAAQQRLGGNPNGDIGFSKPRYEAHENPPLLTTLGLGSQFGLIASAALLVTPVIVAKASGLGDSYLSWMVFASLVVVGVTTLVQVRGIGPVGARAVMPMFTAAFSIPFCITAVVDGGPATLTTLVFVAAVLQIVISKWLFILRRIVTPTLGGTVMLILSITLASVVFSLLNEASEAEPTAAPLTALATLVVVGGLTLRGTAVLRLWAPMIGIVVGCGLLLHSASTTSRGSCRRPGSGFRVSGRG